MAPLAVFLLTLMNPLTAAQPGLRENIEYGRAGANTLLLDAYAPAGAGPFPAAIIVHGGGWIRGDRRASVQPLFRPLEAANYAWFSISYRFATGVADVGAGIEDVRSAIRYVRQHAAEYKVDPNRIAIIGESAGAQLASMAVLNAEPGVRAVVALYSPSDLQLLAKTSEYVPSNLRRQIEGTPLEGLVMEMLRQLSPVNHVRKDAPPFLLIHGTSDALVPYAQSERMCEALRRAGAQCELYTVKGGGHGIRWWESLRLTAYKEAMVKWLDRQLTPTRSSAPQHGSTSLPSGNHGS